MKRSLAAHLMTLIIWVGYSQAAEEDQKLIREGIRFGEAGAYDDAIRRFSQAIQSDPKSSEAYNNRGLAYQMKGDINRAFADYEKAIQLNPANADAYNNRGLLWGRDKQDYGKAIRDLTKAIELDPELINAYRNRGSAYVLQGQYDSALADYNKAIELNPGLGDAYYNRAIVYFQKGDYGKSWEDVQKADSLGADIHPKFLESLREKMTSVSVQSPAASTVASPPAVVANTESPLRAIESQPPPSKGPDRSKGLSVHHVIERVFTPRVFPAGFLATAGAKQFSFRTAGQLVNFFLGQDKTVQANGVWLVVAHPASYTPADKALLEDLEKLCKKEHIILYKARSIDLPDGWKRVS
ncbi:MAG: tetratricopeptide repeat protein [Candidatus Omnitrophica bacterium]|nr:tetratricopeptide repeat protein [Candidatus Omnitrophota bacterium]